ncbi:MAG: YbaK/EbsC family protein [Mogibacterium sp.]|nr:YbaK/EbsC family protein [Mogibacterium sp.]
MSIERVRKFFEKKGIADRILEFGEESTTVEMASEIIGCSPARICKAMAYEGRDGECILIQSAGDAKVSNSKFKQVFGFRPTMMSREKTAEMTGHEIGGICGFAIENPKVKVYCDRSVTRFQTLFPACGSDGSAIEMTVDELLRYSDSMGLIDVCR